MDTIRILIADNQSLTREGYISILNDYYNQNVYATVARDQEHLFDVLRLSTPHVLAIDFDTFKLHDLSDLLTIRQSFKELGILVVSNNVQYETILKIVEYGITNFVNKTADETELIDAFKACISNRKYFSSKILDIILNQRITNRDVSTGNCQLTNTEMEIVQLIAQGNTTKAIANSRKLSYHTIITHRKNIFRKLNIKNMSELILYAMRTGLVDTTEYYI